MQVAHPGLLARRSRKDRQKEHKEQHKQRVLEEHNLDGVPPPGFQRVWTDGSQQTGRDGAQYAGYGVWFGDQHALNHCGALPGLVQTKNRAELQACIHARVTPWHVPLQLCANPQLVTDGATLWLPGWIRRIWMMKQGSPVSNKDL